MAQTGRYLHGMFCLQRTGENVNVWIMRPPKLWRMPERCIYTLSVSPPFKPIQLNYPIDSPSTDGCRTEIPDWMLKKVLTIDQYEKLINIRFQEFIVSHSGNGYVSYPNTSCQTAFETLNGQTMEIKFWKIHSKIFPKIDFNAQNARHFSALNAKKFHTTSVMHVRTINNTKKPSIVDFALQP